MKIKSIIAIRSGELVDKTGYYFLSGPMKKVILLRKGQVAPRIKKVCHVWFYRNNNLSIS